MDGMEYRKSLRAERSRKSLFKEKTWEGQRSSWNVRDSRKVVSMAEVKRARRRECRAGLKGGEAGPLTPWLSKHSEQRNGMF
jgi:hypothetical protein